MPGGSKHIPREFRPPQNSHLCLRRRRNSGSHGMACPSSLPCLTPVSLSFFNSNYESKDSVDCSCGCLEGPSIFQESFILLRDHVSVCGEGEVSQSGFTVPRAQLLIPWYATLFGPLLAAPEDQSGKSGQFSGVVFNYKQVFFSWVWSENACVKSKRVVYAKYW